MALLPAAVDQDVQAVSAQVGVDPNISRAIVYVESDGNPSAVGDNGCSIGLLQINRCTGEGVGYTAQQLADPITNLQIGLSTLAQTPNPGDVGAWAAAAQRPADPAGYAAEVDQVYAQLTGGGGNVMAADSGQSIATYAESFVGSLDWGTGDATLCEAFVEYVELGQTGLYQTAWDAWQQQADVQQTDLSQLQAGDALYFSPNASNGNLGHTGIFDGGSGFVSVTSQGVQDYDVNDWMASTGQQLLGFIPSSLFGGGGGGNVTLAGMSMSGNQAAAPFGPGGVTGTQDSSQYNTPVVGGILRGKDAAANAAVAAATEAGTLTGLSAGGAVGGVFKGFFEEVGASFGLSNIPTWAWIGAGGLLVYKVAKDFL